MVLAHIRCHMPALKSQTVAQKEKLKINLIEDGTIKDLYKRHLFIKIKERNITPADDLEIAWQTIEKKMLKKVR